MHHRSAALDELDTSILGLAAPLALEVRATVICGLVPSDSEIAELVREATQTPIEGAPGIPARVVVESDELIPHLRSALGGVAFQRRVRASEVALMPTLVETAETIEEILGDPSLALSDDETKMFEAILAILDEETEEYVQLLEAEDELEGDATLDAPQRAADSRAMQDAERAAPREHAALHASLLDAATTAFESVLRQAGPKVDAVMEEAAAASLNPQHAVVYVALAAEHAGTNAVGFARKTSGATASAATRKALAMLADARASFFRIRATDPQNGLLTLEDVFAGEVLHVRDYGAARGLEPAVYIFAILVPHGEVHLCVAAHAQPLRSSEAMAAIAEGRKVLRQEGDVALDRLRAPSTLRALFGIWAAHAKDDEARSSPSKRPQKSVDAGTEAQAVLAFKAQHYGSWPDVPVPALDGKTPRAAAKSAKLRPRLVRLLDDMTADEARAPAAHRFDFTELRRELGV